MAYQNDYLQSSLKRKLRKFCSKGRTRFYLSEFAEEAKISILQAEDFFIPLFKANKVEGSLEVRCPNCGRDQGLFKTFPDIPEDITLTFVVGNFRDQWIM